MYNRRLFLLLQCLVLLVISVISAQAQTNSQVKPAQSETFKVTFLMYSGREDPYFIISADNQLEQIKAIMSKSMATKVDDVMEIRQASHPKLGYMGILIESITPDGKAYDNFIVNGADIELISQKPSANMAQQQGFSAADAENLRFFLYDDSRSLEHYLFELAEQQGVLNQADIAFIKQQQ